MITYITYIIQMNTKYLLMSGIFHIARFASRHMDYIRFHALSYTSLKSDSRDFFPFYLTRYLIVLVITLRTNFSVCIWNSTSPECQEIVYITLLPILRFVLDKKFQRNASKFTIFYIYENPKLLFPVLISCYFISLPNECPGLCRPKK